MKIWLLFSLLLVSAGWGAGRFQPIAQPRRIAGGEAEFFMQPRWSPDGQQIAMTGNKYQGIWLVHPDGRQLRQLTDEASAGFGFEWSGDSQNILTRVSRFEGKFRYHAIKIFDVAQLTSQSVTDFRRKMPALPQWAAHDTKIFLTSSSQLEIFDSGKNQTALQKSVPVSPVCLQNDKPARANLDQGSVQPLPVPTDWQCLNLVVSPDGKKLAFEVLGDDLFVMNTDGTGLVDLGEGHRPQWAPDSEHLVFMITHDDGHQYLASDLAIVKTDGTGKSILKFSNDRLEQNPAWSPDGKYLAFDVLEDGAVYIVEIQ
jgi:Tol biopolymer transport system component